MPKPNTGAKLDLNERGIYEIKWTENGRSKRRSTRSSDLKFAEQVLSAFLSLDERAQRQEAATSLLVSDVFGDPDAPDGADYWHEHVIPNVVDKNSVRQAWRKLGPHFGAIVVKDIMPTDVDSYVLKRRSGRIGRPSVNGTISNELLFLNAAIVHAVKKRRLPKGDAPMIELPGRSEPRDRWLSHEEAEGLLEAARVPGKTRPRHKLPRAYRFIAIALHTASRKNAVQELQRQQVDLEHGLIYLNPKGRKQTNKRRARVPISDELRPILARILQEIPDRPDAYLLDHPGCIYSCFNSAVEKAGLGEDVTPHVLRHTKATWMARAGVSMFDIAGILGDTVATVEKTYAHHHPEYLRNAINAGSKPKLRIVA